MNKLLLTAVLGIALGASAAPAATTGDTSWPMMSMSGGTCPMMGRGAMMGGHGMMGGQGMMAGQGTMGGRGMMAGDSGATAGAVDNRLAYLKDQLKITKDQLGAWNGYADAVKDRFAVMQVAHRHMVDSVQTGGALARMDARIAAMGGMLEAMKALRPATAKLYAVLTPEQTVLADRLIGAGCGMM